MTTPAATPRRHGRRRITHRITHPGRRRAITRRGGAARRGTARAIAAMRPRRRFPNTRSLGHRALRAAVTAVRRPATARRAIQRPTVGQRVPPSAQPGSSVLIRTFCRSSSAAPTAIPACAGIDGRAAGITNFAIRTLAKGLEKQGSGDSRDRPLPRSRGAKVVPARAATTYIAAVTGNTAHPGWFRR
jgi:hypothetical protein